MTVEIQVWSTPSEEGPSRLIARGEQIDADLLLHVDLRANRKSWVYLVVDSIEGKTCKRRLANGGVAELEPGAITMLPKKTPEARAQTYYPLEGIGVREVLHFVFIEQPIANPKGLAGKCLPHEKPHEIPGVLTRELGLPITRAEATLERDNSHPWPTSKLAERLRLKVQGASVYSFDFAH